MEQSIHHLGYVEVKDLIDAAKREGANEKRIMPVYALVIYESHPRGTGLVDLHVIAQIAFVVRNECHYLRDHHGTFISNGTAVDPRQIDGYNKAVDEAEGFIKLIEKFYSDGSVVWIQGAPAIANDGNLISN